MKENLTQIVFILDRSGSMQYLTKDTIGGYNSFIDEQKKLEGEALLTTILFDDKYEVLHDSVNLKDVEALTDKEYFARGSTALLDAIGKTINTVGATLNNMDEDEKPSKVIFVITTDGEENHSREFNADQVREMIKHQTEKYQWEFIFLGANIDAVGTAGRLGISKSANYTADCTGTASVYASMSRGIGTFRSMGMVDEDWDKDIK